MAGFLFLHLSRTVYLCWGLLSKLTEPRCPWLVCNKWFHSWNELSSFWVSLRALNRGFLFSPRKYWFKKAFFKSGQLLMLNGESLLYQTFAMPVRVKWKALHFKVDEAPFKLICVYIYWGASLGRLFPHTSLIWEARSWNVWGDFVVLWRMGGCHYCHQAHRIDMVHSILPLRPHVEVVTRMSLLYFPNPPDFSSFSYVWIVEVLPFALARLIAMRTGSCF